MDRAEPSCTNFASWAAVSRFGPITGVCVVVAASAGDSETAIGTTPSARARRNAKNSRRKRGIFLFDREGTEGRSTPPRPASDVPVGGAPRVDPSRRRRPDERGRLRLRVVGLAVGQPGHGFDEKQLAGDLVAGDPGAAVLHQLVEDGRVPGTGLHDGRDPLAPALVGNPDHEHVEHVGMRLQRPFDLFGVDLLAAGVDRHRTAAEQRDAAVGLDRGVVAGDRPALAFDVGDERGRGLLGVAVVAERDVAAAREPADLARNRARAAAARRRARSCRPTRAPW